MRPRQTKTAGAGLEGFVEWMGVVDGEPTDEEEIFSLVAEFAAWMRKQPVTLKGKATSSSREKKPWRSPSDEIE